MTRIFCRIDDGMIGFKCSGGPAFLPGFGRRANVPFSISAGKFPVSAISLYMSAIPLLISLGSHFSSSALMFSTPTLFHLLLLLLL